MGHENSSILKGRDSVSELAFAEYARSANIGTSVGVMLVLLLTADCSYWHSS